MQFHQPLLGIIAWRLWKAEPQPWWPRQLAYSFAGILLTGLGAELWAPASGAPLPAGWGGIIALVLGGAITPWFALAGDPAAALIRIATILVLVGLGLWLAWRALRLEKGWSQEELADQAGLHRTYVSGVERAVRNPTITIVAALAKALGVAPAELLASR